MFIWKQEEVMSSEHVYEYLPVGFQPLNSVIYLLLREKYVILQV